MSELTGVYINLNRSEGRRKRLEAQLSALGLGEVYRRFPGIDGKTLSPSETMLPGELGTFWSHRGALAACAGNAHVLEDDAVLSRQVVPAINDVINRGIFQKYDILFTDTFVELNIPLLRDLLFHFRKVAEAARAGTATLPVAILDLSQIYMAAAPSYVVGAHFKPRLPAMMDSEIAKGLAVPIDLFYRREIRAGRIKAACFFPFLTTVDMDEITRSTSDRDDPKQTLAVMALLRQSFFIESDPAGYISPRLRQAIGPLPAADPQLEIVLGAIRFSLSEKFQPF